MAERNPVVEEWIAKAEGDWDWTEIDINRLTARMRDGYVYHLQQCVEVSVQGSGQRRAASAPLNA